MSASPELALPVPTPARYVTEEQLTESLKRKGTPQPGGGLYPRDGTEEVTEVETALSALTIPGQERNVVVPSGMAAVGGAVEFALQLKGRELERDPVLAYPPRLYTQSTRTFEGLRNMGVSAAGFDPSSAESIDRLFEDRKADVIFVETVSNTPDMPVVDIHYLLDRAWAADEEAPILVLDNTLPLSTGIDFSELLKDEDRVLVVESATKSAMHNSEHLGVVYSAHEALINGFRKHKVTRGLVTSTNADAAILQALEATAPGFHDRNKALYESTGTLAKWVAAAQAAQAVLKGNPDFTVCFPEQPEHPNQEYTAKYMDQGTAPVVFVDRQSMEEGAAQKFLKDISEHPSVVEQIEDGQVFLGQSFGFKEARLLYDPNATQIRIAGGYDIDSEALGKALFDALVDL